MFFSFLSLNHTHTYTQITHALTHTQITRTFSLPLSLFSFIRHLCNCKRRLWLKRKLCNGRGYHFLYFSLTHSFTHTHTHSLSLPHTHTRTLLPRRPDVVCLEFFGRKRLWMLSNKKTKNPLKKKSLEIFMYVFKKKKKKKKEESFSRSFCTFH